MSGSRRGGPTLNRYAAPASPAPIEAPGAPIRTSSPAAATEVPNAPPRAGRLGERRELAARRGVQERCAGAAVISRRADHHVGPDGRHRCAEAVARTRGRVRDGIRRRGAGAGEEIDCTRGRGRDKLVGRPDDQLVAAARGSRAVGQRRPELTADASTGVAGRRTGSRRSWAKSSGP